MKRTIILGIAILMVLMMAGAVVAAAPRLMSFQGKLTNNADLPLTGSYNFTFRIYGAATGGAATWTEVQNGVAVETGIYNVLLGSVTPLNLAFDTGYWLSVEVNGDGEMTPRYRLTSAPYSLFSDTATNVASGGSGGGLQRIVLTGTFDTSAIGDAIITTGVDSGGVVSRNLYKVVTDSRITLADLPNIELIVEKPLRLVQHVEGGSTWSYEYATSKEWMWYIEEGKIYIAFRQQAKSHSYDATWTESYTPVLNGSKYWIVIVK